MTLFKKLTHPVVSRNKRAVQRHAGGDRQCRPSELWERGITMLLKRFPRVTERSGGGREGKARESLYLLFLNFSKIKSGLCSPGNTPDSLIESLIYEIKAKELCVYILIGKKDLF